MARLALLALALACSAALVVGCDDKKPGRSGPPAGSAAPGSAAPRSPVPDRIEGAITRDGAPLAITACRPGLEGLNVYVDLVTAAGALRFANSEAERMFWNPRPDANERGAPIDCEIPHRSWGGGQRADGSVYFRGELAFECRGAAGAPGLLLGKVSLDCGNISALEHRLLDDRRREAREQLPPGQ